MEYQIDTEIAKCERMIAYYKEQIKDKQATLDTYKDMKRIIIPQPNLFMDDECNTIMSRESSCDSISSSSSCSCSCCNDDDASITSNAEDCLLDEINDLKQEFYDFKTRMNKAIKKIDSGFDLITGGCIASV